MATHLRHHDRMTRRPVCTLSALAVLGLAACGPTPPTPVGSRVVSATSSGTVSPQPTSASSTTPHLVARPVGPSDFRLAAKILSQDCFGEAGCNVTYRVQVIKAPHTGSYEVTYDVLGGENGPATNSVVITDGHYDAPFEDMVPTKHRVKALPVRVTSMEPQ